MTKLATKLLKFILSVYLFCYQAEKETDFACLHVIISVLYSINIYDSYSYIYYHNYHRALHDILLPYLHLKFRMTTIFLFLFLLFFFDVILNTKIVDCLQFP